MVTAGTPDRLQSSLRSLQIAGRRGQSCSSSLCTCTGWGRWSCQGLRSALAASTVSLYPHYQMPSRSQWNWCKGWSSTQSTAPQWCVGWQSDPRMICFCGSLPAGLGAWGRLPPLPSPIWFFWALCQALTGAWSLGNYCSLWGLLFWAAWSRSRLSTELALPLSPRSCWRGCTAHWS